MKRPNFTIILLMGLYFMVAILALWLAVTTWKMDLITLGVVPVLIGLFLRTAWAGLVLKIYIAIQTLAFLTLAATAIIAYRITPKDVHVSLDGQQLSIPMLVIFAVLLLGFQWWIAFAPSMRQYLNQENQESN